MREVAFCVLLAILGRAAPSAAQPPGPGVPASSPPLLPQGLRLPAAIAPTSYDLTLELDPARPSFAGHVVITLAPTPGATQLWLHAVDLTITHAALRFDGRDEAVRVAPAEHQMIAIRLPHPLGADSAALIIDYAGRVNDASGEPGKRAHRGLFRKQAGSLWYLGSQADSTFARRIVPCFDEPRFKPAWRVSAIVPRGLLALGNGPVIADRIRPDGRREFRFAEVTRMASYLLAIAVGPFDLVSGEPLGRARIPVRLAVARGDRDRARPLLRTLSQIVDSLERYLDAPLPLVKLDVVAVRGFFGAMENTGLITIDEAELFTSTNAFRVAVGDRSDMAAVMAHELAHQWFGNSVTPAWWDDLWLSEAFATWLTEHVLVDLARDPGDPALRVARAAALAADEQDGASAIRHHIARTADIEGAFDEVTYQKGSEVLAMFENFVGPVAFQDAVRRYLSRNAGTWGTSQAFVDALAAATDSATGAALAAQLAHPGMPVVTLALRCDTGAAVVTARSDASPTPVCMRFPVGDHSARACELAGPLGGPGRTLGLPPAAGCPAWIVGNDNGIGYYHIRWQGRSYDPPAGVMSPRERRVRGDDVASGVRHGELAIPDALVELARLAATHAPDGELAAVDIADAIDPLVADPVRPAWTAWLAARFAERLGPSVLAPSQFPVVYVLRRRLVPLVGPSVAPATRAEARRSLKLDIDPHGYTTRVMLAGASDPGAVFDEVVRQAARESPDERALTLGQLGEFPGEVAPRLIDRMLAGGTAAELWPAVSTMLRRPATASAAWRAIDARLARVLAALRDRQLADLIETTGSLCEGTDRATVAADLAPRATDADRRRALDRALAAIDHCIARRAAAGDIAHALALPVAGEAGRN